MDIKGIDFFAYGVKDLDKAIKFYEDNLGLKLTEKYAGIYAEFDVAGTAFGLYSGDPPQHPSGTVAFNVVNITEAAADLKAKGVEEIAPIEETPVCRMGFYKDLDGNSFMLHEKPKV